MRFRSVIATATVLAVAAGSTPALANCFTARERDGAMVQLLRTELMVAAVSCKVIDYSPKYNQFIRRHESALNGYTRDLKNHFQRNFAARSTREYDSFATRLANSASQRSWSDRDYCYNVQTIFEEAIRSESKQLPRFSATQFFASNLQTDLCPTVIADLPRDGQPARPAQSATPRKK